MRRLAIVLGLQCYAVLLGLWQYSIGLRTDEAKYILDIPYPHPPVARFLMGMTDGIQSQEFWWRMIFATLVVQSVWLVWNMFAERPLVHRVGACVAWLTSGAIVAQAGTLMMAPLTAMQGLVFVWLVQRRRVPSKESAGVMGLFWLASLFTAYQAVLYAPLVYVALRRTGISKRMTLLYWCTPVALLVFYTAYNPLAAASMLVHTGEPAPWLERLSDASLLWLLAGSAVLSVLGTLGIVFSRAWALIASFLLVSLYVLIGPHHYYAVLFVPLLIAGLRSLPSVGQLLFFVYVSPVFALLLTPFHTFVPSAAQEVRPLLAEYADGGLVLMKGTFGHEWQYGTWTVRRYHPSLVDQASAIVCITECDQILPTLPWKQITENLPEDSPILWVREAQPSTINNVTE